MGIAELNTINLNEKELKEILWTDNVQEIGNEIVGTDVIFYRKNNPNSWQRIIKLEEVLNTIHKILNEEEARL
jgi:tRNA A37 N6-isopentenylltransferase MiaA